MKTSGYILLGISGILLIILGGLMMHYQNSINLLITFGILAGLLLTYQLTTIKKIIDKGLLMVEAIGNEDLGFLHSKNFKLFNAHYQHRLEKLYTSFARIKKESLKQENYLFWLIEQLEVGICTFDEQGHILHINSAFKEKVKLSTLTHVNQLLSKTAIDQKVLEKAELENSYQLPQSNKVLKVKKLQKEDQQITLLTLQDLSTELDDKEYASYNKLIRVLTHEIMNGMTPIISLSDGLLMSFEGENGNSVQLEQVTQKMLDTNAKSLKVIHQQAEQLMHFTNTYRSITKLPQPKKEEVDVEMFINQQVEKVAERLKQKDIHIEVKNVNNSVISHSFDPILIGQCVHNILKNGVEALQNVDNPKMKIKIQKEDHLSIRIANNGPEIGEEELKHIFVPFFTTKEKGDGIGLSLSKHIVRVHHGSLQVTSDKQKTEFIIKL
ncbi:GHKL domain-containing protein [Flammeovirga yaeyamensis]|uniref:histidine kinase n=1 Tax=Flammeovirga yaeyamensis TaxID=367791 RepID=A0AAX1N3M0_9BACT|nr:HAMP domain-containing sensor histidine kinase [Flammeovirga yaeyamensis]MBB3700604.1 nitrogen fixation/metabolism regulation signal transduction histidine kinase [Flammeovirga yaeyamensis]NMF37720.1 HAMP domain-containing histidine kinase [Flammeovirga yaeyamensis]QWG02029.1 GHKL domain-containing protein [Flammeovirga yaeyamensis]